MSRRTESRVYTMKGGLVPRFIRIEVLEIRGANLGLGECPRK